MQTVNYSDYIYYAGTTQPVVRVPVYVYETNTTNLASLYDSTGAAIDNPTQTDDNGLFDFWTTFGKYDLYVHNTKEFSISLANLAYFYLGIYDTNPTERPDGSDLQDGDMYFNSVINHTKLYNNGLWYYADDMMNASGVAYDPASGPQTDVQTQMRDYDTHLDTIDSEFDVLYSEDGADEIGFIQDGVDAVATTVQTKLRETVSVKDFGAVGDGVTDDTAAIQAAVDGTVNGQWLDGGNATYKITTQITVTNSIFRLRNAKFVFNTDYADQGQFELNAGSGTTAMTVELENITVDGGRETYKVGNETWQVFTTYAGYDSIVPTLAPVFRVSAYNASTTVRMRGCNFYNVFAQSCLEVGTYGTVFIDDCEFKNIANKTFHVYHSPDDGVTQAGRTLVNNVYAQDVGILPATYAVGGVAKTRSDGYAPQGSFNFIVSHGDFTINNASVWNYASCGVTADRNRSFNASNVFIYHDSPYGFSNNPSGAFWLEKCNTTNVSNLFVWVTDRDARDTALDSSLLEIYSTAGSHTNFNNVVLLADPSVAKVRKIVRGSVKDNPSINISSFYVYGLCASTPKTVSFLQLSNSTIGLDVNLTNGYIRHGAITIEQPLYASVENVTLYGDTADGDVLFAVSGNPGVTGNVGYANISGCEIAGDVTSTVNFTQALKVCGNTRIGGAVSSSSSSGNVQINDNAYIGGSINLTGASSTSGICNVMNNAYIGGTTTLVSGKNGRVSGNNTVRRIEIKDVQTFEVVGNTAKTDAAEPIIWVNPGTAANVLAGVISSNNVLIKTGTVGAGYVTIAGGVTGVTDVNNNKLTVAWS